MTTHPGTRPDDTATGWPDASDDQDHRSEVRVEASDDPDPRGDDPSDDPDPRRDDASDDPDHRSHDPEAAGEPYPDLARQPADDRATAPLLDDETVQPFAERWSDVQARFVDDPRDAVQRADALVSELVREIADRFEQRKTGLEEHWTRGDEPDTEALRQALQQYRALFDRLLST